MRYIIKTQCIISVLLFSLCLGTAHAIIFIPVGSGGNWGDMETWYGDGGTGPLPGPNDDVMIITGQTVYVSGGVCRNLFLEGGASPGQLISDPVLGCGDFHAYGDLNCSGYILTTEDTDFHFTLGGHLTQGYNAVIRTTSFGITGAGANVADYVELTQDPVSLLYSTLYAGGALLGVKLLSDIHLNDGLDRSEFNGFTVILNGHNLSGADLADCLFPLLPDPAPNQGGIGDCGVGSTEFWQDIALIGENTLLTSGVIWHGSITNYGTLWGVFASHATLICQNFINYGTVHWDWYGSMECQIGGNWENHGSAVTDLYFTENATHHYFQAAGAIQYGDLVNASDGLILDSDMAFMEGDINLAGTMNLNGFFIHTTSDYTDTTVNSGVITTGGGGFHNCCLQNLEVYGETWLGGVTRVLDNGVYFHGEVENHGELYGNELETTELNFCADLVNYGSTDPGLDGGLIINCHTNLLNEGEIDATRLNFLNQAGCWLDWTPAAGFYTGLFNQSPLLQLLGDTQLHLHGASWELGESNFANAIELGHGILQYSCCHGALPLTLTDMQLYSTELNLPAVCDGVWIRDDLVVFHSPVQVNGDLMGGENNTITATCESSVLVAPGGRLTCWLDGFLVLNCHGDVLNQGIWNATARIHGDNERTLQLSCAPFDIIVEDFSYPTLVGTNLLSSFQIEGSGGLSVAPGASLQMASVNDYYTGAPGSFVNHGSFSNERSLNGYDLLQYYALQAVPGAGMVSDYSNLAVTHLHDYAPVELDGALLEMWTITPTGLSQDQTGLLTFTHSQELLPREFEQNLQLWYRLGGVGNWMQYTGVYDYDALNHIHTAYTIPVGGEYIFVVPVLEPIQNFCITLVDTPQGCQARLQWDTVSGAGYYSVMASENPAGPWYQTAWTTDTWWTETDTLAHRFYRIVAHTGVSP